MSEQPVEYLRLNAEESARFVDLMLNPPPPSDRLRRAVDRWVAGIDTATRHGITQSDGYTGCVWRNGAAIWSCAASGHDHTDPDAALKHAERHLALIEITHHGEEMDELDGE